MLTFNQELRPAYNHAWKNFVSTTTQTQYSSDDEAYRLKINLPGFRPEDIEVNIEKNVLEVSVVDQTQQEGSDKIAWRKRYQLPDDVDVDNIEAELKLGQLLLTLNKKPQAAAKKIVIKSGE